MLYTVIGVSLEYVAYRYYHKNKKNGSDFIKSS